MGTDVSVLLQLALALGACVLGWKYIVRPLAQGYRQAMNEEGVVGQPASASAWGAGVGPAPGRPGAVIPAEALPPVLTRTYVGKPDQLEVLRSVDAEALANRGYFPTSQNYVEGRWSGTAWVLAFVAFIVLIGIFILVYMIAAKPAGTLTVIYERRVPAAAQAQPRQAEIPPTPVQVPPPAQAVAVAPAPNLDTSVTPVTAPRTKVCPDCAETVLEAARICRFCRHTFIDGSVVTDANPEAAVVDRGPVVADAPQPAQASAFGVVDGALVVPSGDWQEAVPPSGTYRLGGSVSDLTFLQGGRGRDFSFDASPAGVLVSRPGIEGGILDAAVYRWAACKDYPGVFVLVDTHGRPEAAFRSEGPA